MSDHYLRLKEVFLGACRLAANERTKFLDQACAGDAVLRQDVDALLAHDEVASSFLNEISAWGADLEILCSEPGPPDACPMRIGPFTIRDVLGKGGMGVVYLAEEDFPRRTVALKIIRKERMSAGALRRFEYEALALARLQHPGIAQIFEAGTADFGDGPQPYLAMELVTGPTLTRHAAEKQLSVRARLELMAKVCDAVHHAHQKGIVHRDLKPSNILVDAHGQPKVLDLGVARSTDADSTSETVPGEIVGTLPYMSPEQVSGSHTEVDSRADVYSLGVILYELLAGEPPLKVSTSELPDAVRIIREQEPALLGSVRRELRGDIETIAAKALEKDQARRYQSASELAADLRRHLNDEPIVARPPTTFYQLRKFARRHRALVGSAIAVFVTLLGGLAATLWQWSEASRARIAADHEAERATAAGLEQQRVAHEKDVIATMLKSVLEIPSSELIDHPMTVVELLSRVLAISEPYAGEQPVAVADVRRSAGSSLHNLGAFAEAEPLARSALELYSRAAPDDARVSVAALNLARILLELNRSDEADAIVSRLPAIAGAGAMKTRDAVLATITLALVRHQQRRFQEAETLVREALAQGSELIGDTETLGAMNDLADMLRRQGKIDEAQTLCERVVTSARQKLSDRHELTVVARANQVLILRRRGQLSEAEAIGRENYEIGRRAHGDTHSTTVMAMSVLAAVLLDQGKGEEAEDLLRKVIDARRTSIGDREETWLAMNNLAMGLMQQDRNEEAEELLREVLDKREQRFGVESDLVQATRINLAQCLNAQDRAQEAAELLEPLWSRGQAANPSHPYFQELRATYATSLLALERYDEAERLLLAAHRDALGAFGAPTANSRHFASLLASLYDALQKPEEAARWREASQP